MEKKEKTVLSKRMQAVADLVTKGNVAADIGCDHGFVPIYLVENGIIPKAIAMDVNDGPLLRVKEHIQEKGLLRYIEVRKSDGVKMLGWKKETVANQTGESNQVPEADTVIIAGMGGRLTVRILEEGLAKLTKTKELIVQPQSEIFLVRDFLWNNGFVIEQEDMVEEEEKYYQIIRAVYKGKPEKAENFLRVQAQFGPILLKTKNQVLYQYLIKEAAKFRDITVKIQEQSEKNKEEKLAGIRQKQKLIKDALGYF